MLIALTGATGFIGMKVAEALVREGHEVRALVRRTSRRERVEPFVAEWRVGDLDDPQAQAGLVAGVDAVVHNAADWSALEQAPSVNFRKNVLGSLGLLEQARLAGVAQFVFVSSVAVHHEILPGGRIDETHPTWPSGVYGAYKAAVESHLKAYHHGYGMNTSAWRPAAVYGVDPNLSRSQWYDLILAAREGKRIETDKGGKITHVQDVADALALAVGDASTAGEFYNLVDTYLYWQTVAELAREATGSAAEIVERKGSGPKNQIDCAKAIAFFDRHGNQTALRRGLDGVRGYVAELLAAMR